MFRRHVRRRSENLAGSADGRKEGGAGNAEVGDLHLVGFGEKNIVRLDVPVDDAERVRSRQGLADLSRYVRRALRWESSAGIEFFRQIVGHVFEHYVRAAGLLPDLLDLDNVGMLDGL